MKSIGKKQQMITRNDSVGQPVPNNKQEKVKELIYRRWCEVSSPAVATGNTCPVCRCYPSYPSLCSQLWSASPAGALAPGIPGRDKDGLVGSQVPRWPGY